MRLMDGEIDPRESEVGEFVFRVPFFSVTCDSEVVGGGPPVEVLTSESEPGMEAESSFPTKD